MLSVWLILAAIVVLGFSGVPGCPGSLRSIATVALWRPFSAAGRNPPALHVLQQGQTHFDVLYVPAILLVPLVRPAIGVSP